MELRSCSRGDFHSDEYVPCTLEEPGENTMHYNYVVQNRGVSDELGVSLFFKSESTYSYSSRGIDGLDCAYEYFDLASKDRDENAFNFPMV